MLGFRSSVIAIVIGIIILWVAYKLTQKNEEEI